MTIEYHRHESTLVGTGSTDDTILVLFQIVPTNKENASDESYKSTRPFPAQSWTTVNVRSKVRCQQLIRMGAMKERGEIGENFEVSQSFFNPYSTFAERNDPSTSETPGTVAIPTTESTSVTCDDQNTPAAMLEPSVEETSEMPNLNVVGTSTVTGTSTDSSSTTTDPVSSNSLCKQSMKSIHLDYFRWSVNRLNGKTVELSYVVPGFTAVRCSTVNLNFHVAKKF